MCFHDSTGDVSTDGRWCYIMLWVVPHTSSIAIDWSNLEARLLSECPSCLIPFWTTQHPTVSATSPMYMLKLLCTDQKGLLHAVTQVLCELELTIQRVKVMTNPDGRVLDLFFITDGLNLLHTKKRRDDTCNRIRLAVGDNCITYELELAGPEYGHQPQSSSSFSPAISRDTIRNLLGKEPPRPQSLKPEITIDNFLSPAHTLLQVRCVDQKGLLYDILRTFKDLNITMTYGRFSPSMRGARDMDLFIQQNDGCKIVDIDAQAVLCARLKEETLHSLRVIIVDRGPDTELLVANPVELSGKGRPRVFLDATFALKSLGICIFSAEVGRHSFEDGGWEVYRFLLVDRPELPLTSSKTRDKIVDRVWKTLMGW